MPQLHGQALKDSIVNSDVRDIFKKILIEEIELITNMIKYGKIKGWIPTTPTFKMG